LFAIRYIDLSANSLTGEIPSTFLASSQITSDQISVYLENNDIRGTMPASLASFARMDIRLSNNRIEGIAEELCSQKDWFGGAVGLVGSCDAILCPPGFFSNAGRQISLEQTCLRCESLNASPYYGKTKCTDISERNVLMDLYTNAGGSGWQSADKWGSTEPICTWFGIECNGSDEHSDRGVTSVRLSSNNLAGTLSADFLTLPAIEVIDFSGNEKLVLNLDNTPEEIRFLETLDLSYTKTNSIDGIAEASNLKHLSASGLSGRFPV
jgi:hypothetical protein